MQNPHLTIKNVCKTYDCSAPPVLDHLSLGVQKGERIALVGASGCGKSTLLNLIAGIDSPDAGDILLAGEEVSRLAEPQRTLLRRRNIGFVYQSFNLIPALTALENIQLPLQLNGREKAMVEQLSQAMLARVELDGRGDAFPDQLSGGEQQRVAIARALVHSPSLVLADEHTGNLDAKTGASMLDLFSELSVAMQQTVLMVTHSEDVASTADRIVRMEHGKIQAGTAN